MARLSTDDYTLLQQELDRSAARALGPARRASGALRNAEVQAWLRAGDNLAEKAVAALDSGDQARADRLVQRIIALPVVDEEVRSGLMAVHMLLFNEVYDPAFQHGEVRGRLDRPLDLLPTLDGPAATELRQALAAMTDYELPPAAVRRIRAVVPLERRLDPPFVGLPEEALPDAVLAVLGLVLRLRAEEG